MAAVSTIPKLLIMVAILGAAIFCLFRSQRVQRVQGDEEPGFMKSAGAAVVIEDKKASGFECDAGHSGSECVSGECEMKITGHSYAHGLRWYCK